MKNKIIILGASGGIGKIIFNKLNKFNDKFEIKRVVRHRSSDENEIFWDYQSKLPKEFNETFLVVNCARSDDFNHNINFNKLLVAGLKKETNLINFSSNCIFAKPKNFFTRVIFRGDAYMREKLKVEEVTKKRSNTFIFRPTIVIGEKGWSEFLQTCSNAKEVHVPDKNSNSVIKIISSNEVGEIILDFILSRLTNDIPDELYTRKIKTTAFIDKETVNIGNSRTFFNNIFKNYLTILLTSIFIPDWLAFKLQLIAVRKFKNDIKIYPKILYIEGMTRLYLFGNHTHDR